MRAPIRKRDRDDQGFTLIELMVVVLIIAILLAIAIPTFLGARERAANRAAQSDIRNALTAEKVFYSDNSTYTAGATGMNAIESIEPSLVLTLGAGTTTEISLRTTSDSHAVCIEKVSKTGATFSLIDIARGPAAGTYYAESACPAGFAGGATPLATPAGYAPGGW